MNDAMFYDEQCHDLGLCFKNSLLGSHILTLLKFSSFSPEVLCWMPVRSSLGHQSLATSSFRKKRGLNHLGTVGVGDARKEKGVWNDCRGLCQLGVYSLTPKAR